MLHLRALIKTRREINSPALNTSGYEVGSPLPRRAFRFSTKSKMILDMAAMNQSQPSELFIPTSFHFPHPLAAAKEDQGTNQLRTSERRSTEKRWKVLVI